MAAVLAVSGCDCGGGGGPDGGDSGTPLDLLCSRFAAAECDFAVRCGEGFFGFFGPFAVLQQQRPNGVVADSERARCEAFVRTEPTCLRLVASLKAGRSTYSAERFDACLQDLFPAQTCARDLNRASADCISFAFAAPATAVGELCEDDGECAGGFCDGAGADAGVRTCGACAAYRDGGACPRGVECEPEGYYCAQVADAGECRPRKALADPCNLTSFDECGPGLVCAFSGAPGLSLPRCTTARLSGQGCTVNKLECRRTQLPPELVCARASADAGTAACAPLFAPPGGACNVGDDLTAAGLPPTPICPETEYCDTAQSLCVPRRGDGAPCSGDGECAAGTRCLTTTGAGACTAYSDTEGSCGVDADCKNLLTCRGTGGHCRTQWLLDGESSCSTSRPTAQATRPCAEGYCDRTGTVPACRPLLADGELCGGPEECRSQSCSTTCQAACWMP
ncbi:MAG TPA: Dickkopf N-terminal cysteine-rich domain-containing protein [Myxococcales bacterium]|nr:Dickkopf N-terminal cysteine-rich domain-containing protein [Myxococcales bacterium]